MPQDKQPNPVRIINDAPATENINLGFDALADTLAGIIANKDNSTPLVMGVYGAAGRGKTTTMRAIQSKLDGDGLKNSKQYRRCKTIWFNAWKHDGEEALLAALIETVFKAMDADGFFSLAKTKIDAIAKRIDKSNLFASISRLGAGTDISEFFADMAYKEKLGSYDTFQKYLVDLVWTFLNWRFKTPQEEKPDDKKVALVIFIDDLDRCTGLHIIKVLETITLYLSRTGWAFVLGTSRQTIHNALEEKYGGESAGHFMKKMIPVGFDLPLVSTEAFDPIWETLLDDASLLKAHHALIIPALEYSPSNLKQFINALNLLHGLLSNAKIEISFDTILHWGVLGLVDPELASDINDNPHNLIILKKQIKKLEAKRKDQPIDSLSEEQLEEENVPHRLRAYLGKPYVADFTKALNITEEQHTAILSMSHAVDFKRFTPSRDAAVLLPRSLGPSPMVSIDSGPLLFGDGKTTEMIDAAYDIEIYLVINDQFKVFIDAGGYANQSWWTREGWQWRKDSNVRNPAYWNDPQWCNHNRPVVGISWYEADAYARWAGMALPSEKQWERAARGIDGWEYPWGNKFQEAKCNTNLSITGTATPVYRYSNGVSSEGCYDMAGNVWEWTSSSAQSGQETYFVKGGSCFDDAEAARCASRRSLRPGQRLPNVGFRCIRVADT